MRSIRFCSVVPLPLRSTARRMSWLMRVSSLDSRAICRGFRLPDKIEFFCFTHEVPFMPFDKVDTQVDFPAQERAILEFWERIGAFEKLREKNRGKPKWSFLDGPITANNPMGVHHAWGRTYKDVYQRYFAMTGHEERYQNGFDCQGLWVEVEVEKELGLRSKRDIENLVPGDRFASIDKFVQLCKERVDKFARVQTEQSIRLGYWMDWDRD